MTISCTRRLQFCAGHRVMGHENKCANLHGHNYVVLLTAEANQLDDVGRIVDFSVLKARFGEWIDRNWDHGFIVYNEDSDAIEAMKQINGQRIYIMDANPTAENMAQHLLAHAEEILDYSDAVTVTRIELWETENCYATATLTDDERRMEALDE